MPHNKSGYEDPELIRVLTQVYWTQPYGYTEDEVKVLSEYLRNHKMEKLLDLGCGVGDPSIGLAVEGFHVTAIDSSETCIEECRRNYEKARQAKGIKGTLELKTMNWMNLVLHSGILFPWEGSSQSIEKNI